MPVQICSCMTDIFAPPRLLPSASSALKTRLSGDYEPDLIYALYHRIAKSFFCWFKLLNNLL